MQYDAITITTASLRATKNNLCAICRKGGVALKSATLTEALARGLGYNTNAALRAALDASSDKMVTATLSVDAFAAHLGERDISLPNWVLPLALRIGDAKGVTVLVIDTTSTGKTITEAVDKFRDLPDWHLLWDSVLIYQHSGSHPEVEKRAAASPLGTVGFHLIQFNEPDKTAAFERFQAQSQAEIKKFDVDKAGNTLETVSYGISRLTRVMVPSLTHDTPCFDLTIIGEPENLA